MWDYKNRLDMKKASNPLSLSPYFIDWRYIPSFRGAFTAKRAYFLRKLSGEELICIVAEDMIRFVSARRSDMYWEYKLPEGTKLLSDIYFFEDKLVVISFDQTIYSFDIAKRTWLWSRNFTGFISLPPSGFRNTVILPFADSEESTCPSNIIALSIETGDTLWQHEKVYLSPISIKEDVIIYSLEDAITECINLRTGDILWQSTSGVSSDYYWFNFYDDEVFLLGNRTFRSLDLNSGNTFWTCASPCEPTNCAAFKNDVLFFISRDEHACAVELNTGKVLWKYRLSFPPLGHMQILLLDQYVMFRKENVFYIFEQKNGKLFFNKIFTMITNKNIIPAPAVTPEYCFITDGATDLLMVSLKSLRTVWHLSLRRIFSNPVVSVLHNDNVLYLVDEDGVTASINLHSVISSFK